jgi:ribonuclease G
VDDPALHREVSALVEDHEPRLPVVVQRHAGPAGVLDAFGLEAEIEKALRSRVWLRSGGYLVINQLEALVAVDVNTGKFTGKRHLEDTALRTNLEAAHEVARQLRLRDLGGIVVIDFIDLLEPGHRQEVMDALKEGLARDRAKTTVLDMSPFGLVQLTRQRQKPSLEAMLAEPCPYCQGSGRVQSVATTANHVLRRARALAASATVTRLVARVHPDIARHLRARLLSAAERGSALPVPLVVVEEAHRHRATFDVAPG